MIDRERRDEIERWIRMDAEYGDELRRLLEEDPAEAARLFDGRIAFGTAGLRAAMGPGPRQMNRLVVQQTTAGLLRWLPPEPTVVIGYDARYHSKRFADDVARIVAAAGGRAELVDQPAPTPVLARAVLDRAADAGVMITASHNPAADNGYKLYLSDGLQLVDPSDGEIAALIDQVAAGPAPALGDGDGEPPIDIGAESLERHRAVAVEALLTGHREVSVLYTAMHGVGGRHLLSCFAAAGFPPPAVVTDQFEPDPDFPTAPFPNPEEPGAFDLAYQRAASMAEGDPRSPVDIILANDPDADRLAVAVLDDEQRWRRLSGDEVGALLADHVLRHRTAPSDGTEEGADGTEEGAGGTSLVASSIVSSRFIDRLADAYGAESIRTLTGFKWVARPIVDRPEDRYLFGYEEALGYCIGDRVRDKDGISAALVMAELAAECIATGTTVWQRLGSLIERHGLYATAQVTMGIGDLDDARRVAVMQRAVDLDPGDIAGTRVVEREDLSKGERLPPTAGVVLRLEDDSRVIVRPSGTEPKIKAYLEVVEPGGPPGYASEARRRAGLRLRDLEVAVTGLLGS